MTDVDLVTMPALSHVARVELMIAGEWDISTGKLYCTPGDMANAVSALDCPAVRRPILKLGHVDPRFDGEPAVGWIDEMATTNNGFTLVGDYVGMPGWLGAVLPSAFPDRSIEGEYDFRCQLGHTHPFVITAVALLGVSRPGIGTLDSLQDIASLYGVAAADSPEPTGTQVSLLVRATAPTRTGAMVALLPSDADAERLAVDGGEPADQLHVTLRYLGTAADIDADDQQRITDAVTAIAGQAAPIDGEGFSVALFNPTNPDRDTCIALGINGDGVDTIHDVVEAATDGLGLDLPAPMSPWTAHVTLEYTDDADQVEALIDRTGPIVFDRLRIAFGDVATDVPLTGEAVAAAPWSHTDHLIAELAGRLEAAGLSSRKDHEMPNPNPREVAAGVSTDDVRRQYYDDAPYSFWITEMQLDPLQLIVCDDNSGKTYRVGVTVDATTGTATFTPAVEVMVEYIDKPAVAAGAKPEAPKRLAYASRVESRPAQQPKATDEPAPAADTPVEPVTEPPAPVEDVAPPVDPAPQTPAAEPVQPPIEEDDLSTIISDVRSRLGVAEDAPDEDVLTALDAALAKANEPAPEPVAAAANAEYATELRRVSAELAEIKAASAESAKTNLFKAAVKAGKIAPADVDTWTGRYDLAPAVITEILASIADGTAVPINATGYASTEEPALDAVGMTQAESDLFPPIVKG